LSELLVCFVWRSPFSVTFPASFVHCTFVLSYLVLARLSKQARARGRLQYLSPRTRERGLLLLPFVLRCAGSHPSCAEGDELEPVIIALSKHPNVQCSKRHPKYESALWTNAKACLRYSHCCWLLSSLFRLMRRVFRAHDLRPTGQYAP
jgi:hypothetical protein